MTRIANLHLKKYIYIYTGHTPESIERDRVLEISNNAAEQPTDKKAL